MSPSMVPPKSHGKDNSKQGEIISLQADIVKQKYSKFMYLISFFSLRNVLGREGEIYWPWLYVDWWRVSTFGLAYLFLVIHTFKDCGWI